MFCAKTKQLFTVLLDWPVRFPCLMLLVSGSQFQFGSAASLEKVGYGQLVMSQAFSFEDAHQVVGALTTTFASFWESVCQEVKTSLEAMDYTNTGRVKLSDFYGANVDGVWHFGESEAYLREIGAMDESSVWNGKQVIISNYIQGASNCIVHSEHYFLCCLNECEGIMKEIERDMNGSINECPWKALCIMGNPGFMGILAGSLTGYLARYLNGFRSDTQLDIQLHFWPNVCGGWIWT